MPLYAALCASAVGELLLVILAVMRSPWLAILGILLALIWLPVAAREVTRDG